MKMEAIGDPKRRKDFVEGCYKQVLQGALTIAGNAGNVNNNIRNLFVETIDKICVPLSRIEATSTEVMSSGCSVRVTVGAGRGALRTHQAADRGARPDTSTGVAQIRRELASYGLAADQRDRRLGNRNGVSDTAVVLVSSAFYGFIRLIRNQLALMCNCIAGMHYRHRLIADDES